MSTAMTHTEQKKTGSEVTRAERTRSGRAYLPDVDIVEMPDKLLLVADVPGCRGEDIDVSFENGTLTINGRVDARQPEDTVYLWREYGLGDFHRSFEISEAIDASRITAECRAGVLTLHLPKAESARPRKITVRAP